MASRLVGRRASGSRLSPCLFASVIRATHCLRRQKACASDAHWPIHRSADLRGSAAPSRCPWANSDWKPSAPDGPGDHRGQPGSRCASARGAAREGRALCAGVYHSSCVPQHTTHHAPPTDTMRDRSLPVCAVIDVLCTARVSGKATPGDRLTHTDYPPRGHGWPCVATRCSELLGTSSV